MARQLTRSLLFASQHPRADLRFAARAPLAYLSLPRGDEPPWYGEQKLGWIGATHVWRHWRRVALDDLSLRATITGFFSRARWTSEMLVRAPPIIDLFGRPGQQKVPSKLPPHVSRTREL